MPFKLAMCVLSLSLLAQTGCNANSFDPENAPYGDYTPSTVMHSTSQYAGVTSNTVQQVVGQKTLNGKNYDRMVSSNVNTPNMGLEWWITQSGTTIEIAGIDASHSHAITPIVAVDTAIFNPPVVASLSPPVGVPQQLSGNLTITMQGSTTPHTVQTTAQYTLLDNNAKVDTSIGTIYGCSHFSGSISSVGDIVPSAFAGISVSGEIWYHPSFGIVALSSKQLGLTDQMDNTSDCGTPDAPGYNTIRKVAMINSATPNFELDTYACSHDFNADKDNHAKMLLELRWADEANARTTTKPGYPMVNIEFGTVWGTFPSTLIQSPVSILHPEENGNGFVYWLAYVNQAAKNESSNGIAYHVTVTADPSVSPIRASARIYYNTYNP